MGIKAVSVTSLAEVWIEIIEFNWIGEEEESLPLRKCGLKSEQYIIGNEPSGHFPCGSVD